MWDSKEGWMHRWRSRGGGKNIFGGKPPLFWIYLTLLVTLVIRAHIFCPQTTQELPKKHHDARMPEQLTTNVLSQINYRHTRHYASSQTQGQIVGRRESLNGRKNMTRRKVKNGEKSPWGQCLTRPVPTVAAVLASDWCQKNTSFLFFVSYFSARLDFPSSPLSAPGSPRMDTMKIAKRFACANKQCKRHFWKFV